MKNRSTRKLTESEKDTLEAAWESLEEPKRSDFVNEWSEKLEIHWRTIDNNVEERVRMILNLYVDNKQIGVVDEDYLIKEDDGGFRQIGVGSN